jgi:undecaprenyl-diphosphatase
MLETLNHIDHDFFIAINSGLQSAFLDAICPVLRNQKVWYPLYAFLLILIYRNYKNRTLWIVLGAAALVLISDQLSANLVKNFFQRLRPCNDPSFRDQVRLLVPCGNGFSFMSAHATNHFAIALFLSGFFEAQRKWLLPVAVIWAAAIAFSQVYVGVHYPFDVICGGLTGSLLGYIAQHLLRKKIQSTR